MKIFKNAPIYLLVLSLLLFTVSPLPPSVYAADQRKIEFATDPNFGTESGTYSVQLNITPSIPGLDPGFLDPSKVMLGVYHVPKDETFDPSQRSKYSKIFERQYSGNGSDTTFTLQDYVTKNALPKPGDSLVAYLDVYALDMMTYSEGVKESIFSVPFTIPGEAEKPVEPSEPEVGSLTVKFQTKSGTTLVGGDYKIIQLTGTGTKDTVKRMPYGKYIVRLDLTPEGYIPLEPHQYTVDIDKEHKDVEVIFTFEAEAPPKEEGAIPYVNLTPVLAPDHPSVFIRIEDTDVHPVNGLTVTIIDSNQKRHPVLDAKLNTSDETPYKILALPIKLFADMGMGNFQIELKQPGYQTTLVPLTIAERTMLPVVNEDDAGYVYVSDNKMTIKTEPHATLNVTFLIDPRSEENILSVDAANITETSDGIYTVDFSALVDQLTEHKIVKVIASKEGKAPSEIVEVALKQKRADDSADTSEKPTPEPPDNSEQPVPNPTDNPSQPVPNPINKPSKPEPIPTDKPWRPVPNPTQTDKPVLDPSEMHTEPMDITNTTIASTSTNGLIHGTTTNPSANIPTTKVSVTAQTSPTSAETKAAQKLPQTGEYTGSQIPILLLILIGLTGVSLLRSRQEK